VAGWLVAWSQDESQPDSNAWAQSTRAALRYGGSLSEYRGERVALASWRRGQGEFPLSGTIVQRADAQVAWVGQCVDDAGDATEQAISCVASDPFDGAQVAALNGPFAAVIVREKPLRVRVLTDRYRHYPVYVHRGSKVVVASTELRCVVPWLAQTELDRDSIDMLLRCGELIDRMTMLRGVELLPPATVLDGGARGFTERRYWAMRHDGSGAGSLKATAELLAQRLTTAVRRLEAVTPRLGITLSGGLDSRIILDLCKHPERVPSFTWGLPECRDIVCASQFARVVKSPHVVKHWDPPAFSPLWSRGVDLTAGSFGIESMFMLPYVGLLGSACDVVFNGLAGDVILGGNFVKGPWMREQDAMQLGRAVWRWRVPLAQDLLVDRLTGSKAGESSSGERWAASIAARGGARPVERLNDWLYENRIFRTTNCGTMLLRGGVESHAPFFDRDFVDAVLRVDLEQKVKHRLYLEVMKRAAPRSASATWQRTNLAPGCGFYANLGAMAFQRLVGMAGGAIGMQTFPRLKVADPAGWLRGPWRRRVEEIILDGRFFERKLLDPSVVRETWQAHLNGADYSRQIGVMVAVELFARLAIDRDPP
jgi:asparagine synthetase B (glutamine-hydrolysing)